MEESTTSFSFTPTTDQPQVLTVPLDGSLALLAMGEIGLLAWRAAKNAAVAAMTAHTVEQQVEQ
jgi:hypothetical protein